MLNVAANPVPVVIHRVQHLVRPPDHLLEWPDDDHSSRIVFIVKGLFRDMIERSLAAFSGLGASSLQRDDAAAAR